MQIFRLMWVESSLDGSVRIDILHISFSSSDNAISFTIKSSRIIVAFTFLAFVQPWLTRVDLSFLLRSMTLKIYLLVCSKTAVAVWVRGSSYFFTTYVAFWLATVL